MTSHCIQNIDLDTLKHKDKTYKSFLIWIPSHIVGKTYTQMTTLQDKCDTKYETENNWINVNSIPDKLITQNNSIWNWLKITLFPQDSEPIYKAATMPALLLKGYPSGSHAQS